MTSDAELLRRYTRAHSTDLPPQAGVILGRGVGDCSLRGALQAVRGRGKVQELVFV